MTSTRGDSCCHLARESVQSHTILSLQSDSQTSADSSTAPGNWGHVQVKAVVQDASRACIVQTRWQTHICRPASAIGSVAYKIISSKGSCCAEIHLWLVFTCACRSLSRSPLSQPRSDARTKINRYRTLFGWVVSGSWYLLAISRGELTMKALHLGTICAFVRGFPGPDRQGRWASPRWSDLS